MLNCPVDKPKIEASVANLLDAIGEDPEREGLIKTPHRVAEAMTFLTSGYREDVGAIIQKALFNEAVDEMVFVRDIDFYSLCEHHILPFYGKCHVAYIPNGKIVGLSKMPRVVEAMSRRLQVQERLTHEIAQVLMQHLEPQGVAVVMEGFHMCMAMRGVRQQHASVTTSAMLGCFRDDPSTRKEFLSLLGHSLHGGR